MIVKPLEWKDKIDGGMLAHSIIGMFTVEQVDGGFVYTHHHTSGETKGYRPSFDEAKIRCYEILKGEIERAIIAD